MGLFSEKCIKSNLTIVKISNLYTTKNVYLPGPTKRA